jgi:hypothetical protein
MQLKAANWTEAERGRAASYAPGQVVVFHQNAKGFPRGERATVLGIEGEAVTVLTAKQELKTLPLAAAARFQVFARGEIEVGVGDLVRVSANGRDRDGARLNNGAQYRVEGFTGDGDLVLHGAQGAPRVVGRDFGHVGHGYVATSHSAQGKTVDRVFIAQGSESFGASNREQFYVSASRGRLSVQVFTDDKAELARAILRSGQRVAASEMVAENEDEKAKAPSLIERIQARALEIARTMRRREEREPEDGERYGVAVRGWPARGREPGLEPSR